MDESNTPRERAHGGRFMAGLILIGVGVGFLLYNLGVVDFEIPWRWWPLILVAIGGGRLVTASGSDEVRGGAWMVLVGTWLLVNLQGWFGLSWHNSWPLMIVAAGIMIAWGGLSDDGSRCGRRQRRSRRTGTAGAGETGGGAR